MASREDPAVGGKSTAQEIRFLGLSFLAVTITQCLAFTRLPTLYHLISGLRVLSGISDKDSEVMN